MEKTYQKIPTALVDKLKQLDRLVEQYPTSIPLQACAKILKVTTPVLRCAILQKQIPGAIAWRQSGKSNHGYRIMTLPFYRWMTGQGPVDTAAKKGVG